MHPVPHGSRRFAEWAISLSAFLIVACMATVADAFISPPSVVPEDPTEDDPVTIQVTGGFPDLCWRHAGHECEPVDLDSITIHVYADDIYQPGYMCPHEVQFFAFSCEYGLLPAGHYVVTAIEYHDSIRDPDPDIEVIEFDVRPSTPVAPTTWGRLRALYRQ